MKMLLPSFSLLLLARTCLVWGKNHSAAAFKYHNNRVNFERLLSGSTNGVVQFQTFTVTKYHIPEGQDPRTHNMPFDVHKFQTDTKGRQYIEFSVGRHGTPEAAEWMNARFRTDQNSFGHYANELNFIFIGNLTGVVVDDKNVYPFVLPEFALAQGSWEAANNWWVAGKHAKDIEMLEHSITINSGDPNFCFTFQRGSYWEHRLEHPDEIRVRLDNGYMCQKL